MHITDPRGPLKSPPTTSRHCALRFSSWRGADVIQQPRRFLFHARQGPRTVPARTIRCCFRTGGTAQTLTWTEKSRAIRATGWRRNPGKLRPGDSDGFLESVAIGAGRLGFYGSSPASLASCEIPVHLATPAPSCVLPRHGAFRSLLKRHSFPGISP